MIFFNLLKKIERELDGATKIFFLLRRYHSSILPVGSKLESRGIDEL